MSQISDETIRLMLSLPSGDHVVSRGLDDEGRAVYEVRFKQMLEDLAEARGLKPDEVPETVFAKAERVHDQVRGLMISLNDLGRDLGNILQEVDQLVAAMAGEDLEHARGVMEQRRRDGDGDGDG